MHVKSAANGIAEYVAGLYMQLQVGDREPVERLVMSVKLQKDYGLVAIG